jgi:hypothetical protein
VALCLNTTGLRRCGETAVLNVLIDIFTSKKTMRVLTSDTPAILGSGLEELLRWGLCCAVCWTGLGGETHIGRKLVTN